MRYEACCYRWLKVKNSESKSQLILRFLCVLFAVIVGSKLKILKANHNHHAQLKELRRAVIVGSKLKILKANHNR